MTRYILDKQERLDNCLVEIAKMPVGEGWSVEIKPYSDKRSINQNNTMHAWLKIIDDYIGNPKDYTKDELKVKMKLYDIVIINTTPVMKLWTTAQFSKEQMIKYMDAIQIIANSLEIKLPMPDKYKEMMR